MLDSGAPEVNAATPAVPATQVAQSSVGRQTGKHGDSSLPAGESAGSQCWGSRVGVRGGGVGGGPQERRCLSSHEPEVGRGTAVSRAAQSREEWKSRDRRGTRLLTRRSCQAPGWPVPGPGRSPGRLPWAPRGSPQGEAQRSGPLL